MKYPCFCHHKDYQEMTKEEARAMLRGKKPLNFRDFIGYYKINNRDVYGFMLDKGMRFRGDERSIVRNLSDQEKLNKGQIHDVYYLVEEVPLSKLMNHYGAEEVYINGKVYYDSEDIRWAKERFEEEKMSGEPPEVYSELRPIDLKAMRYYRDVNVESFSRATGLKDSAIKSLEHIGRVSEKHAKIYMETLKISQRHIVQLKDIMLGKADRVTDNRYLPKTVKVGVWARDKGACVRCKKKENLHYHHKIRFSEGGQNTMENLIMLCASCHAEEHEGEKGYHMLKKMAGDD